jgi:hypothetical protein
MQCKTSKTRILLDIDMEYGYYDKSSREPGDLTPKFSYKYSCRAQQKFRVGFQPDLLTEIY